MQEHIINTCYLHTLSPHLIHISTIINAPFPRTLSSHSIQTSSHQIPSTNTLNTTLPSSLSSHPIHTSSQQLLCTHPNTTVGMIGFDGTKAEAAHYATALRTSDECIKNLTTITNNCSIASLGKEILSVYGYNTSRVMCYDFYADGMTLCNAATTDTATAQNLYGTVGYSPPVDVQKSFPNYGSYPSVSSGTFLRSFVR